MSSDITMYDTILNSEFPPDADAYAAYVDGGIGNQPNYAHIVAAFPRARHLSVALFSKNNADALDVEPGAAWPAETAIAWYAAQRARGLARPCLYASVSTMQEFAVPVIGAALIPRAAVRLWTAHYGKGEHICGPNTCRQLSIAADGTQWTANALGRDLDQSLLLGDFFTVPTPTPGANWTYGAPLNLRATGGHTSVGLSWSPPAGAPRPVSRYQVYVYNGTDCNRATLVSKYPRGTASTTWEGGSLVRGRPYTAHVVAAGAEGTHVRPYCYASATFTTG